MNHWSWTDRETVAANQAGHLTPVQEQLLRSAGHREAQPVHSGIGLISGVAGGSRTMVDGQLLGRRNGSPELPPAGWYQMYWLRDDASARRGLAGWLLSVSAPPPGLPRAWSPGDAAAARVRLLTALGFDIHDLAANRQGRLTDAQRRRLTRERRGHQVASGLVTGLGVFMAALLTWVLFGHHDDDSMGARLAGSAWPAIGMAASVVTIVAMSRERVRATAALRAPAPVEHITGPVMLLPHDDGDQIGTLAQSLAVTRSGLKAFEPDRTYVVYYVPEPPLVLSAEPDLGPGYSMDPTTTPG
jgi:hypothetical protein